MGALDTDVEVISGLTRRVDVGIASRLLLESDVVFAATLVRSHEGVPFCVTTVWLPPAIASLLDDVQPLRQPGNPGQLTVLGLLDQRLADPVSEADQSITVSAADPAQAAALRVEAGSPLLRVDRLFLDTRTRPVELSVSSFVPERYSYRVKLRRNSP
jgi:GntR family transcriptional regulator